jgi:hypothetical protein
VKPTYSEWLKRYGLQESDDYNLRDAYSAGVTPDARGHLPDTYKRTNHITYSTESVYSKQPGAPAPGVWSNTKGKWTFYATPTNIANAGGADKLVDYFKREEPDSTLVMPMDSPMQSSLDQLFSKFKPPK